MGVSSDKKRQRPAQVVEYLREHRSRIVRGQLRLWAFGYDMDNMKSRCWYESTLPLYGLVDCEPAAQKRVESEVGAWLSGAELAAFFLRSAVKDAWFGGDAKGDFSVIDASFWSRTEEGFYRQLQALIEAKRENIDQNELIVRESWHRQLIQACLDLFDKDLVGAAPVDRQNPRRVALAYQQLKRNLYGPKMRQALALPALEPAKPTKKTQSAARAV